MKLQRFEVSDTPQLIVVCDGDLDVNGGRDGEVAIKAYGQEDDLNVVRDGEHLTITSRARCKVGCPRGTNLTVQAVHGDARLRRLDGPVIVENAHGDLALKIVGPTTVTTASGDVRARSVNGDLFVDQVAGDLSVRGVEGSLSCGSVAGDLKVAGLKGGLEATVSGDAAIRTDFAPGCDYRITASGDVSIRFPRGASARFQVTGKRAIRHKVDWADLEEATGTLTGRVGEGEANVEITSDGDVVLEGRSDSGAHFAGFALENAELDLELESMAEEIERNVQEHMVRLNAQLEDKLSRIDHDAIRLKIERTAEGARRKAERAAERARMKAERAQRRWERMGARRPSRSKPGAPPTRRTGEPITEQERVAVLRMVQEGKITADEAARLLEAMQG